MTPVGMFRIEAGHPSLPGHFPGRPVVPGVLLLDEAMACAVPPGACLAGFDAVKFLRPVLPGEDVQVLASPAAGERLSFACTVNGEAAVRGTALLLAAPPPDCSPTGCSPTGCSPTGCSPTGCSPPAGLPSASP